ncbi:hypothetical protein ACFVZW_30570 [Streptomyces sp. NPDC059567]|uniref:hypothetical protein n=1 Tax=Streptomyces sp. NPDC059567 TaxID=3346867 RepID=UPI0036B20C80
MAAHAAVPTRRPMSTHGLGLPVTLGVIYGFYAAFLQRDGGAITWGQVLLGFVSAIVLAGAMYALRRGGHALPRELRATAWAALAGIAMGFLVSLSDTSVLSTVILALVVAACVGGSAFYWFYTHEDAPAQPPARRAS